MSVGRSSAWWSRNRYADAAVEPAAEAPLTDLPAAVGGRFRAARDGLLALEGVSETVRYMGTTWRWAWEYGIGNRKLCWLHLVADTLSTTFTLSDDEVARVSKLPRLAAGVTQAVDEGQRTGPVRWCWLDLSERRHVDGFLRLAKHKAAWLAQRPMPHRAPRLRGRGGTAGEGE